MISVNKLEKCCGCSACVNICPKHAINFATDYLGFHYPEVDQDKCIKCGLCLKVCKFKDDNISITNNIIPDIYGIRNKNIDELNFSQSGGAFWIIAQILIKRGYIIYGVGLDEHFTAKHKRATSLKECKEFRGSKYTQSELCDIFKKVKIDLLNNLKVLFVGTPCQIDGIKSFLGNLANRNLITIDIVCHAVPSPKIWQNYLDYIEEKYNQKIKTVNFRDKRYGWHSHFETFILENGAIITDNIHRMFFYNHLTIRPSCTRCIYTNFRRVSDITIGDFWGWEKYHKEWNDNKGVSLVIVNTDLGKRLFELMKDNCLYIKSNTKECIQPQLIAPIKANKKYNKFTNDFERYGFNYVLEHYGDFGWRYWFRIIIGHLSRYLGYYYIKTHSRK